MSLPEDIDIALLPGVVREIADLVGVPAAIKIVGKYGGVRLSVPLDVGPEHPLAELIGLAAAEQLARTYGGMEHFDIPRCARALRHVRVQAIRADRERGHTHRTLALRYCLTERAIRKILNEQDHDTPINQGALF